MGTGYVRQEAANIVTGNTIEASHLNNEFNQLQSAFDGTTGHSHDGTTGEGPTIVLTTSVTGTLPIANGGTNATTESAARTALGVAIGSDVQAWDTQLDDIAALAVTDSNFIVGDGANWVVESGSTARSSLGLGSIATQASSSIAITGGTIEGTPIGGTTAAALTGTTLNLEDATNQIILDSDAANTGTVTLDTLTAARVYTLPDETGTIVTSATTASTTTSGIVELATTSEVNTGTDTSRAITSDALSGSNYGKIPITFSSPTLRNTETGNGQAYYHIPSAFNGMNLVDVEAFVATAGTTGTTDIQIHNQTDTADMLSTVLTIDSGETNSSSAATPAVIDTGLDDVATGDIIRIDIDAISTTPAQGLVIIIYFQLP